MSDWLTDGYVKRRFDEGVYQVGIVSSNEFAHYQRGDVVLFENFGDRDVLCIERPMTLQQIQTQINYNSLLRTYTTTVNVSRSLIYDITDMFQ